MRAVLQRVKKASVTVDAKVIGEIHAGWLILLGVAKTDQVEQAKFLAEKVLNLRVFSDADDKFNLSALDTKAELLVVSQFTLYADCRKGRRPNFTDAAPPEQAIALYENFVSLLKESGLRVATGVFQAKMLVALENDGPVTIILDTP
jgi:D-aminoacyl-tRNA deacylase